MSPNYIDVSQCNLTDSEALSLFKEDFPSFRGIVTGLWVGFWILIGGCVLALVVQLPVLYTRLLSCACFAQVSPVLPVWVTFGLVGVGKVLFLVFFSLGKRWVDAQRSLLGEELPHYYRSAMNHSWLAWLVVGGLEIIALLVEMRHISHDVKELAEIVSLKRETESDLDKARQSREEARLEREVEKAANEEAKSARQKAEASRNEAQRNRDEAQRQQCEASELLSTAQKEKLEATIMESEAASRVERAKAALADVVRQEADLSERKQSLAKLEEVYRKSVAEFEERKKTERGSS